MLILTKSRWCTSKEKEEGKIVNAAVSECDSMFHSIEVSFINLPNIWWIKALPASLFWAKSFRIQKKGIMGIWPAQRTIWVSFWERDVITKQLSGSHVLSTVQFRREARWKFIFRDNIGKFNIARAKQERFVYQTYY